MKKAFRVIRVTLCLLSITSLFAQSSRLSQTVFTQKDGLEIDRISSLAMDDDGFLWIGGSILDVRTIVKSNKINALQRFDGSNFHNIKFPEGNEPIINVEQLYKRKDGKFYIKVFTTSEEFFYLFDPKNLEFTKLTFADNLNLERGYSNIITHKGKEYFLFQKGTEIHLGLLDNNLNVRSVFSFSYKDSGFLLGSHTSLIINDDFIVVSDDNFPVHFVNWQGTILKKLSSEQFARTKNSTVQKKFIDSYFKLQDDVFVFFNGNDQMQKIDNESYTFTDHGPNTPKNNSAQIKTYHDKKGVPVICISNGDDLEITSVENGAFNYRTVPSFFESPSTITIFSKDITKDAWIGTKDRELHYLKFPSEKVKTYLPDYAMRSLIHLDSLRYLVASETEGWFTIDKKTMKMSPFIITENGVELKPKSSRNIIKEGNTLWSNSHGNLLEIDVPSQTIQSYRHYPVLCMERLNDSTLIYGTNNYNLMAFNTKNKVHKAITETRDVTIYDIAINDNFLVGATNKGMLTYNFTSQKMKWVDTSDLTEDPFFLMTDYIDGLGFVLGGREGDIITYDDKSNTLQSIYKDELKAGVATLLLDNDILWINTFNGVVSYNLKDNTKKRFSEEDGLSSNEANRYSALKTDDGLFVGMIKGLNYFKPEELQPVKKEVSLKILKLRHYKSEKRQVVDNYNISEININNTINIPTEYKELSIDFSLTNNTAPNEYRYRYKFNDEWIDLNQNQSISFPNLAPGLYTIEIEALSFSGNKVCENLVLHIDSKEFFYKKWWFYAGLSLIIISILLYLLQQSQLRQMLQQKFARDLIASQETERKRIAKDLHDSVGQRLTLIKRKTQKKHDEELTDMTNDVLEEVRSISRGLYPANLKVLGLTESITQLVYEIDEQTNLFITLDLVNMDAYFNESGKLNVFRFVQESLTNILKHSKAKEVSIISKKYKDQIVIKIFDNGVGFAKSDKKRSDCLGLKTLEERITVLNGKLEIKSKPNKGTRLTATIPIK